MLILIHLITRGCWPEVLCVLALLIHTHDSEVMVIGCTLACNALIGTLQAVSYVYDYVASSNSDKNNAACFDTQRM